MKYLSKTGMLCLASAMALGVSTPAHAGLQDYVGDITMVGFNFCPRGTAAADGQLLPISQNTALFSLYGTIYGGDGRSTFALPDLRGRIPMHSGRGPGLTDRREGQRFGTETNTLTTLQLPPHGHTANLNVSRVNANTPNPIDAYFARAAGATFESGTNLQGDQMHPGTVTVDNAGGGQAVNNMQPALAIRFCVALVGIYPSRN